MRERVCTDALEILLRVTDPQKDDSGNDDESDEEASGWDSGRPKKTYPLSDIKIARVLIQVRQNFVASATHHANILKKISLVLHRWRWNSR